MPDRTWFITGCSQGLGRELAVELINRGQRVAATARRLETLDDLKALAPDRVWTGRLDVTKPDEVKAAISGAIGHFGRIDVLVNNAGYGLRGAAEEVTDDELRAILETNLVAPMAIAREVIPHMRENGGGQILQISTQGGQVSFAGLGAYHASKWGLEGFTESLAQEVAPFNIGVTIVEPGGIRTEWGGASMQHVTPLPYYDETPFGQRRKSGAKGLPAGDAVLMAKAIANAVEQGKLPLRLPLGSDTVRNVGAAIESRLAEIRSQADFAAQTDAVD
jgi:NAD(P)-dependent dehydrogenase (short-subunit alcohol dehydrogenase family)